MNWPRARMWLIIAFLALDILLAYVLFSDSGLPYRGQSQTPRRLAAQLARYGLQLEAQLPPDPGPLPLQGLEQLPPPTWLLPTVFPFGEPTPETSRTPGGGTAAVYRGADAVITMEPDGRVSVYFVEAMTRHANAGSDAPGAPGAETVDGAAEDGASSVGSAGAETDGRDDVDDPGSDATDVEPPTSPEPSPPPALPTAVRLPREPADGAVRTALLQAAEAWVDDWGGLPDDRGEPRLRYDAVTGLGLAAWRQFTDGLPLYGSYLQVVLAAGPDAGATAAPAFQRGQWEWRWFRPLGPVGDPRPLVPAQTALLRLAGHLESMGEPGGTITAVTLGYYTGVYEAETWEVPPVWRLDLADGRYFYVNALTGELEAD